MIKLFKKINESIIKIFSNFSIRSFLSFLGEANTKELRKSFILLWTIVIFITIIVIWASFSEINQVVRGNGEVTPESQVHLIQSSISGPIEKVNISLGDKITKGAILFNIAKSQHYQNYKNSLSEVEARRKKVLILEDLFNKGAESEIRLIDEKLLLLDAERRYEQARIALDYSEVKSSVSGTVSQVHTKNIGQVVTTGSNLAEIVPDNANLRLKVLIQTKDIAFVRPNLSAKIAFTSYDMAIYGQFDGIVKTVSASTSIQGDDQPYYTAIIEVDDKEIKRLKNIDIQSGMQASVSIIGNRRTILSYLFNPITKLSKTALRE